jgi:putative ABC transport system permease protein
MIRIAWKRIHHRKWTSITILIAFISIYTLVPFGLKQSKTATTTVHESIEQYGRGSYDLLVRPPSSRTKIEQELGMVEENYIGDSKGGISIAEWKKIKEDPDIEVAAPVASLGYFRGKNFSIEFPVLDKPTRFTYQFYTSDGQKKYPLGTEKSIVYFEQKNPGMIQYLANKDKSQFFSSVMSVLMPENYYLLVAIDPESETKLTGIDFSDLNKETNSRILQEILKSYGNPPVVKVLQNNDLNIPLYLKLTIDQLDVQLSEYLTMLNLQEEDWLMEASPEKIAAALTKLEQEPIISSKTIELNLSSFQKPFDGTALKLSKQFEPLPSERFMAEHDTSLYYVASKIDYQNLQSVPTVKIVSPGEPPSYKRVEKKGVSMEESWEIPFIIEQVGTFSPKTTSPNKLAASPLGIYGEMEATTEDGTILTPTTIPGSFIPSPASGVTTLESAELIKGEKPIDAIRVRIAGITSYDQAAQEKIEKVATKLLKMGYEVDIVAGSSFKEMTLEVEGIGKVKEPWTTLGVAQELTETWNLQNVLTTALLIIFGVFWLIIRLTFEKNMFTKENELLSMIGWEKRKIHLRNCIEQYILITIALTFSLFLLYVFKADCSMYWITVILWAVSLLVATYLLTKKNKNQKRMHAYKGLASILYYKRLIIPMMFVLCLSTLLMSIQVAALGDSLQKSAVTTLGDYINDQTYWFQLIVVTFVFYLSIIAFSEGLNTLFSERKQELVMYHVIGWPKRKILRYLFKEASIWSLFSILIGIIIGGITLYLLNISIEWILIGLGSAFILLSITLIIILYTRRIPNVNQ